MSEDTKQNAPEGIETPQWTPELLKQRRRRAAIMAIALVIWVGMFFWVTLVRLATNVTQSTGGGL